MVVWPFLVISFIFLILLLLSLKILLLILVTSPIAPLLICVFCVSNSTLLK